MIRGGRRSRALIGGLTVLAAVVVGEAGPAPAQVEEPDLPEVVVVDAFGPTTYAYEDCEGVVHTEQQTSGFVFIELDDVVDADLPVALSFSGSLADDLVDPPTEVVVAEDDSFAEAEFAIDDYEVGDLTVTVEPGPGYTVGPDASYELEVTDEIEEAFSCDDDLGTPPGGTDRQTIDVGERPVPIGFFDEDDIDEGDSGEGTGSTVVEAEADEFARAASVRAVPDGYSTPVVGELPPGLTYADDEWGGAATTPGTYAFDIRLCFDQTTFLAASRGEAVPAGRASRLDARAFPDVICFGTVDVVIEVRAVAGCSCPTPARPAAAVRAQARFTG